MSLRHASRWFLILCLAGSALEAEMATRRWGTPPKSLPTKAEAAPRKAPVAYVPETRTPPTIDGTLDDAAWAVPPLRLERTLDGSGRAAQPTEVRLLRDERTLYLAFRCTERDASKIKAAQRPHDSPAWEDDSVEFFLGFGGTYCHFAINAAGSTYDAKGKDASWNSGLRAAVAKGEAEWTAEVAIPLGAMVGADKPPTEWIANFNRNRYVTGSNQESAWSPTFSGDSHAPARFGKLFFSAPQPQAKTPDKPEAKADAVEVLPCAGGEGIVRFDLSGLPGRAKVCRADLLLFRTAPVTGADEAAMAAIAVFPLLAEPKAGAAPEALGKPLNLRQPWLDRFDATAAVREACSSSHAPRGTRHATFLVKTCPLWDAEATCLEVAYEGEPKDVPPQATGLNVLHRAGQTFLTWKEVEPLLASEKTTWGEIRQKLANAQDACSYHIYAHSRPITARNLPEAELLADVGPLSAYNVNARNKEYLLGQAMVQPDEMGELARDYNGYMHTWTMDSPRMDRYPVGRFVIDEKAGPLPVGTGLYVRHPDKAGRRYYAVAACRNGVENTKDFSEANALTKPVEEAPGLGEPVCQGKGLWGPFFDYPGTRWVYVQWCAPPLSPRPNMAFNWSVLIPPKADTPEDRLKAGLQAPLPAELYFHPEGYSYAQPGKKMLLGSIQIAPHDYPPSAWYGFNDSWGTLKSFRAGVVRNHTQRRIIAFLDWATRKLPIDPNRILAVGADGAAALALSFPDRFAYVLITGFDRDGVLEPKAAPKFAAAWGPRCPDIQDEKGRGEWRWADLDELVHPGADLPLFVCRGASWGGDKGWGKGRGRFYRALHAASQPLVAHWAWGGSLQRPDPYTGLWRGLDLRRDSPVPAMGSCSLDREGEGDGNANVHFSWKDVRETPDGFEITILCRDCTFDFTPRRLGQFKVRPGEKLRWQATQLAGRGGTKVEPQGGDVAADERGLVPLRGLTIPRDCPGVKVTIERVK